MPRKKKHPKDMTSKELATHLFHPEGMKHIKEHVAKLDREKGTKKA
jgi:hypothetical protein